MLPIILITLLGAFYIFAGLVAARIGLTTRLLDAAIASISLEKAKPVDVARLRWNLTIATMTFVSGALLILRLDLAVLAFFACAALQALYLFVVAPRRLDPPDPPDAGGRRQSVNAFTVYCVATALVVWAWSAGQLMPILEAPWPAFAAAVAAIAAYGIYLAKGLADPPKGPV